MQSLISNYASRNTMAFPTFSDSTRANRLICTAHTFQPRRYATEQVAPRRMLLLSTQIFTGDLHIQRGFANLYFVVFQLVANVDIFWG